MPSIGMFRGRKRPSGMEFGVCTACNKGTRGADAVAAAIARLHPDAGLDSCLLSEMRGLMAAVGKYAPGVREELGRAVKSRPEWLRRPMSGLLQRVARLDADGPKVKAHLGVYGAKLAMALYREHVGKALPLDGAVWCQFSLSGGVTQKILDERVKILSLYETLSQGSWSVGDQFACRYNTNGRTVVAALAQFHRGLWYTLFASCDQQIIEVFHTPELVGLPASVLIKPGGLLQPLSSPLGVAA
jgi:hypothetical protein